jgi:hypothetical protein
MDELFTEIEAIIEKLKTNMSPGQKRDWNFLLEKRVAKLKYMMNPRAQSPKRLRQ